MALINVKNPDLYRAWLRYLERVDPNKPGYAQRTEAFFASQRGQPVPLR